HESVDPGPPRVLHRLPGAVDVHEPHAAEPADDGRAGEGPDLPGDLAHGLEILVGGYREARLDDVDVEPGELPRHFQLLLGVHREAGGLLAIAKRGVEDDHAIHGYLLLGACRRNALARAMRRVQRQGGARGPHARRTPCTLSVRPRAPTPQMGPYHRSSPRVRAVTPTRAYRPSRAAARRSPSAGNRRAGTGSR